MKHLSFVANPVAAFAAFLLFAAILLFATPGCHNPGSEKGSGTIPDSTYTLTGDVEGLDSGWVYLVHRQSPDNKIDSAYSINGRFVFTGRAPEPEFCLLGISNAGRKEFHLGLFVQNGSLVLSGKKDSIDQADLKGSPAQDDLKRFDQGQLPFYETSNEMNRLYETAKAKNDLQQIDSLATLYSRMDERRLRSIISFVRSHPSSYVSAYEVCSNFENNPEVHLLDSAYKGMDSSVQASFFGKIVKEMRDNALITAVGSTAPDFVVSDVHDKPVALASFKGKYVLVDFWASWCGPCRAENPNVVKAYHRYHPKGFAILGVSLDDQKNNWEKAIKKDKLGWTQVSDLKGWESSVAALYGVKAIPMNFLLDKDGKILGKGLRGKALEDKLASIFP